MLGGLSVCRSGPLEGHLCTTLDGYAISVHHLVHCAPLFELYTIGAQRHVSGVFIFTRKSNFYTKITYKKSCTTSSTRCSHHTRGSQQNQKVANKWLLERTKKPTTPLWSGQTDRQTDSDAYEPTVQLTQVGSKIKRLFGSFLTLTIRDRCIFSQGTL